MSAEEKLGFKFFLRAVAGSGAPVLVVPPVGRLGLVLFNEGPSPVRLGTPSGTVSSRGILLPSGMYFTDNLSDDDWWAQSAVSSGTISGFYVEG